MKIVFYSPLRPPDHVIRSEDRRIARLLVAALQVSRHTIELVSFASRDRTGDRVRQAELRRTGSALAQQLIERYRKRPAAQRPQLWFTHQLDDEAPDWIGPPVAEALGIPYVVAEAAVAGSGDGGPWDLGHHATIDALGRARLVISLGGTDSAGIRPHLADPTRLAMLPPFVDRAPFDTAFQNRAACRRSLSTRFRLGTRWPWMLAVGMLRHGAKLASYRLLAQALSVCEAPGWTLVIVGDGPARAEVRQLFEPYLPNVVMVGEQPEKQVAAWCAAADLMVWPAIDEAYGLTLVEAHAAGLPIVAGGSGGVPEIVRHERTGLVTPPGDARAFAAATTALLVDDERRQAYGAAAHKIAAEQHDLLVVARRLDALLTAL